MPRKRERNRHIAYAVLYPRLVSLARKHGYALALHGSMVKDCDIIAVPWIEEPSIEQVLAEAIAKKLGATVNGPPTKREHGRLVFNIIVPQVFFNDHKPFYFDFSVMQLRVNNERKQ